MRTVCSALVVGAALGTVATQASAVVTFAFDDNPSPHGQFVYEAPNASHPLSGVLEYNSDVKVDLAVDATGEGGNEFQYTDATFEFYAEVGIFNETQIPGIYLAPLTSGSFSFTSAPSNLLMPGSFGTASNPAYLTIVIDTATVNASALIGGLEITAAPHLADDLNNPALGGLNIHPLQFAPPFDSVWTLSNMSQLSSRYINNGYVRGVFLEDFIANTSYSGTAGIWIPAPGAWALGTVGVVLGGIRRGR